MMKPNNAGQPDLRVACYARVSTTDQTAENQLRALREHAERAGWTIVATYTDTAVSGTRERRPGLDALMDDARRRKFDLIAVAALDLDIDRVLSSQIEGTPATLVDLAAAGNIATSPPRSCRCSARRQGSRPGSTSKRYRLRGAGRVDRPAIRCRARWPGVAPLQVGILCMTIMV
ncbi:MAG: resolvase [Deltaproteobacteria bacterium]|nr:resolvase [Deltaproteobacteria bacterium]